MFEDGYRGSVVAALVVVLVCVLASCHRSHGVDEAQMKCDRTVVHEKQTDESKGAETGRKLDRYASEAQPAWAREHPGRDWPDTIDELNKYIGACDSLDSWGHPIKLLCGAKVPGGGCTPVSAGADGQFDTGDDQAPF